MNNQPRNPHQAETEDLIEQRRVLEVVQEFSDLPKAAKFVIFVSERSSRGFDPRGYEAFLDEATQWARTVQGDAKYASVVVVEHATSKSIADAVNDPGVAGLTFIGHGTLTEYWCEGSTTFGWVQMLRAVTHLKLGEVYQATCGHVPRLVEFAVPLGTAAVRQLSNLYAAPGVILPDKPISYKDILIPPFDDLRPLDEQLVELNKAIRGVKKVIDKSGKVTHTRPC